MGQYVALIVIMAVSYYIGKNRGYSQAMKEFESAKTPIEELYKHED